MKTAINSSAKSCEEIYRLLDQIRARTESLMREQRQKADDWSISGSLAYIRQHLEEVTLL